MSRLAERALVALAQLGILVLLVELLFLASSAQAMGNVDNLCFWNGTTLTCAGSCVGPSCILDGGGGADQQVVITTCDFEKATPQTLWNDGDAACSSLASKFNSASDFFDAGMAILPDGGGLFCKAADNTETDPADNKFTGPSLLFNLSKAWMAAGRIFNLHTRWKIVCIVDQNDMGTFDAGTQPLAEVIVTNWPNTYSSPSNNSTVIFGREPTGGGSPVDGLYASQGCDGDGSGNASRKLANTSSPSIDGGLTHWLDANQWAITEKEGVADACSVGFDVGPSDGGVFVPGQGIMNGRPGTPANSDIINTNRVGAASDWYAGVGCGANSGSKNFVTFRSCSLIQISP